MVLEFRSLGGVASDHHSGPSVGVVRQSSHRTVERTPFPVGRDERRLEANGIGGSEHCSIVSTTVEVSAPPRIRSTGIDSSSVSSSHCLECRPIPLSNAAVRRRRRRGRRSSRSVSGRIFYSSIVLHTTVSHVFERYRAKTITVPPFCPRTRLENRCLFRSEEKDL
ncbi:hypothetical protein D8S78_19645 [Natrialba swarupiae]|nr:hypothetical protein [Natrialba swarupiae]